MSGNEAWNGANILVVKLCLIKPAKNSIKTASNNNVTSGFYSAHYKEI